MYWVGKTNILQLRCKMRGRFLFLPPPPKVYLIYPLLLLILYWIMIILFVIFYLVLVVILLGSSLLLRKDFYLLVLLPIFQYWDLGGPLCTIIFFSLFSVPSLISWTNEGIISGINKLLMFVVSPSAYLYVVQNIPIGIVGL